MTSDSVAAVGRKTRKEIKILGLIRWISLYSFYAWNKNTLCLIFWICLFFNKKFHMAFMKLIIKSVDGSSIVHLPIVSKKIKSFNEY